MKHIIVAIMAFFPIWFLGAQARLDSSEYFGLDYLIESGINKNTKLEPIELQRKIELIKKEQVTKQPTPMLETMIDYIPVNLMDKPEYSVYYSQRLMLPKKLNTNELITEINAKRQEIEKDRVRLDLTRQIKTTYYSLYYYEKLLRFNLEYQDILKNITKTLELTYSSGMGTQNQILKMNNELQMLEFEKIEIEKSKQIFINTLRVLTNLNLPDNFQTRDLQYVLDSLPEIDSVKFTEIMVKHNPEFKMIENMVEGAKTEKKIAELERIPDITIKGGYKYMAKEPMSYLVFSFGIDLPFMPWNSKRIKAMVDEKTTMELQAYSVRNSLLQYMKNELQNIIIMINSSKYKLLFLKEVIIPETEQIFNSTIASYSSGYSEFMSLLDTYRKLRESVQMQAMEESEILKQYAELEFLLGKQIIKK